MSAPVMIRPPVDKPACLRLQQRLHRRRPVRQTADQGQDKQNQKHKKEDPACFPEHRPGQWEPKKGSDQGDDEKQKR
jgi:hypothetical protein